ncbi:hypothetical protein EZV62_014954 [Acer yangbiense]|uniref:MULE transposase domain-containing protein n=1 Tax=Acer yangbiense TaxID=1000413 RepID=A0A5C7HTI0_9ROSI|nr:hypothetical protein EZV62_014954 [Acer yangbiense]
MAIVESVFDIPVQDPPEEDFSSADLTWTQFGNAEHHDDVALIPYERVDSFIIGECSNVECPTRFHIERGRKRSRGSLKECKNDEYLEYRLYWCSFGPENYGEGGSVLPSRKYRLNTRNRAARPQSMRGCTCHFVVKRLYARPSLALLIYNDRRHVNKSGFICHGPLDRDAIGPGAKKIPYICNEIQQQTMSMIYLGIPEESVLEKHIEGIQRYCGSDAKVNSLASQYVQKLGMIIKRSTHELDLDDQASIRMWVERNKKSIFFYQDSSETNPFILGIQTEWQLQQMIRFGHHSLIAADSTFGIKQLKYPLCTLLVFDSRQHALPVAWIITRSFAKPDVAKWMKALLDRARGIESGWKISGFLIDDAAAEIDPIRHDYILLSCLVFLMARHLRVDWLVHKQDFCCEKDSSFNIKFLSGRIVYGVASTFLVLEDLKLIFYFFIVKFSHFIYRKVRWFIIWPQHRRGETRMAAMNSTAAASSNANAEVGNKSCQAKDIALEFSLYIQIQYADILSHCSIYPLLLWYKISLFCCISQSFLVVMCQHIPPLSIKRVGDEENDYVAYAKKWPLFTGVLHSCDCRLIEDDTIVSLTGQHIKRVNKYMMICACGNGYGCLLSTRKFTKLNFNLFIKTLEFTFGSSLVSAKVLNAFVSTEKMTQIMTIALIAVYEKRKEVFWIKRRRRRKRGVKLPFKITTIDFKKRCQRSK